MARYPCQQKIQIHFKYNQFYSKQNGSIEFDGGYQFVLSEHLLNFPKQPPLTTMHSHGIRCELFFNLIQKNVFGRNTNSANTYGQGDFLLFLIKKKKKRSIDSFYFSFFSRGKRYRIIEEKWSQPFLQYLVYFLNNKKIACV